MNQAKILAAISAEVFELMKSDTTGHDWWHAVRVKRMAGYLAKKENANQFICEAAGLLHDIGDWKFTSDGIDHSVEMASEILQKLNVDTITLEQITDCIDGVSYKGSEVITNAARIEGKVVQDADRLDAMGAIGIARTFAYGGSKGRKMYDPEIKPAAHICFGDYKKRQSPTLNHFFEKLLLLKDRFQTASGQEIARIRHERLQIFVNQFLEEWNFETDIQD